MIFQFLFSKFWKKTLTNVTIPLARDKCSEFVSNLTSNTITKMKKISGKGVVRARKRFTKLISDEDMNKIIKTKKSLEHSSVLIDAVTEPVKVELKKTRR